MKYVHRQLESAIIERLNQGKAIAIYGPRQAGKTTLARKILQRYDPQSIISFQTDDPAQAELFQPNVQQLSRIVSGAKVLFIDEAQSITNAGLVLKLLVDNFPEVQVVVTGSSSFELSDKIRESMVGRVHSFTLLPFSALEVSGSRQGRLLFDLERMLELGGYPEPNLQNDQRARELIQDITSDYLFKDILDLADVRQPDVLRKLLTALALQVGQEVSYNELANMLDISHTTVERYIYLLEQCFILYRLTPLSANPRKVLASRKRKIYFYDLGVRSALAGQLGLSPRLNPLLGGIFENFCVIERHKQLLAGKQTGRRTHYWRSPDSEVDYVEQHNAVVHTYEIKYAKLAKRLPKRFTQQFPAASFTAINKDNFWQLLDAK